MRFDKFIEKINSIYKYWSKFISEVYIVLNWRLNLKNFTNPPVVQQQSNVNQPLGGYYRASLYNDQSRRHFTRLFILLNDKVHVEVMVPFPFKELVPDLIIIACVNTIIYAHAPFD